MLLDQMRWFAFLIATTLFQASCSAQTPARLMQPKNDDSSTIEIDAASSGQLQLGEYGTEKGWGRLRLEEQEGILVFSIESVIGEDYCTLDGTIKGDQGIANSDHGPSACAVKFTSTPRGIDVVENAAATCEEFCGYNGGFEALYLRVKDGCGRGDIERIRADFKRLYDGKNYKAALSTLSPVLENCLPTLEWEEEGAIRNDLAITQYKNGLLAECFATLDKYTEDSDKDDDAVIDGWTPVLADRYLAIVRAARTNIGLCRKAAATKLGSRE